jgi:hypothetical protein
MNSDHCEGKDTPKNWKVSGRNVKHLVFLGNKYQFQNANQDVRLLGGESVVKGSKGHIPIYLMVNGG